MVQILVRGRKGRYIDTQTKAQDVVKALNGLNPSDVPSHIVTDYRGIWSMNDPAWLGQDDNKRPIFSLNFRIQCEPKDSDNREPL